MAVQSSPPVLWERSTGIFIFAYVCLAGYPPPVMPKAGNDTIETLGQLLEKADDFANAHQNHDEMWWRGHSQVNWQLTPSVFREGRTQSYEANAVYRFRRKAHSRYTKCPEDSDLPAWLFLMQHYGLPTRLLDWTGSCLVAMFFAVNSSPGQDGAIWALDPFDLNTSQVGKSALFMADYTEVKGLARSAFMIEKKDQNKILAITPREVDVRMLIQQSTFTIHGGGKPLEEVPGAEKATHKLIVPAKAKPPLRTQLRLLGFSLHTLFPDLGHLAEDLLGLRFPDYPVELAPGKTPRQ